MLMLTRRLARSRLLNNERFVAAVENVPPALIRPTKNGFTHPAAVVIGSGFGGIAAAIRLQGAGLPGVAAGNARPAGRPGVRLPAGRFHLRRRADHRDRAVSHRRAFRARRTAHGRLRADRAGAIPFTGSFSTTAARFDYTGDEAEIVEQIKLSTRTTCPATCVSWNVRTRSTTGRSRTSRTSRLPGFGTWQKSRRTSRVCGRTNRSTNSSRDFIKDPYLRQVFSFHPLLIGGNPFQSSSIYSMIHYLERRWGVHFAMGGTGAIVDGSAADVCRDGRGFCISTARVTEITTDERWRGDRRASGGWPPFPGGRRRLQRRRGEHLPPDAARLAPPQMDRPASRDG